MSQKTFYSWNAIFPFSKCISRKRRMSQTGSILMKPDLTFFRRPWHKILLSHFYKRIFCSLKYRIWTISRLIQIYCPIVNLLRDLRRRDLWITRHRNEMIFGIFVRGLKWWQSTESSFCRFWNFHDTESKFLNFSIRN